MKAYRIINLSTENLAAAELLSAPGRGEWRDVTPPLDDEYDAAGCANLLVTCTNCGMAVREACGGVLCCPDCGEEYFTVQELFVRIPCELPGLAIRVTGKAPRRFLHIDVPAEYKSCSQVYYTFDGSEPTCQSGCYRHPFSLPATATCVKAVVMFGDYRSQTVSHQLVVPPTEYSYLCPVCACTVKGTQQVLFCHGCGFRRVFYSPERYADYGIDLRCDVCGATIVAAEGSVGCSRCGCHYSYSKARRWVNRGVLVRCGYCHTEHKPTHSPSVCPSCGCGIRYKLSEARWVTAPAPSSRTSSRSPYPTSWLPPVPGLPKPRRTPKRKPPLPVDVSLGNDVWKILQFIFFLLVLLGLSYCNS